MYQKKQNSTSTAQQHGSSTSRLCRTAKIKKTRSIQFACAIRVRRKTWCSMSRSRWWRRCDAGFCVACKLVFSLICLILGLKLLLLQHVCNCSFNLSCGILQLRVCYFVFPVFVLFFNLLSWFLHGAVILIQFWIYQLLLFMVRPSDFSCVIRLFRVQRRGTIVWFSMIKNCGQQLGNGEW